jgi:putative ABC transport system permease protein
VLNDLRVGARLLVKDRAFTIAAVLVLGLGIAATNTAFTLANGALLRDMPFEDPERVVELGDASYLELRDWHATARAFEGIAGVREESTNVSDEQIAAEHTRGAYVSAHAFALLGRQPVIGRDFRPDDERVGAASVVILGHTLWRTRYRSDAGIVGRTIRINGRPSTVIGVMPEGFEFPINAKLWQPLTSMAADVRDNRSVRFIDGFGRLRPGVSRQQARTELTAIDAALRRTYPENARRNPPTVASFRSGIGGPLVAVLLALMGAVTFVLLIACANVANLLLARAAHRAREISIRMSLGATRVRIVRQLLVESLLLACLGGAVALLLSSAGIRLFWRVVTQIDEGPPYWLSFPIDGQVLAFLAAVCLTTAIVFGLAPAIHTARTDITPVLNETSSRSAGTRRTRRWAGGLVIAQLALALVLLSGAGLMMRNLLAQVTMDAGVSTAGLMRMAVDLPATVYPSDEQRLAFYDRLDERLRTMTGMQASLASAVPMGGAPEARVLFAGGAEPPLEERPVVSAMTIGPRYFETVGARLLRGRMLLAGDGRPGPAAVIVNQRFVDLYFAGRDPLGERIRLDRGADWLTVVGVAGNIRQRRTESGAFDPVVYLPIATNPVARITVLARSAASLTSVGSSIRTQVSELDPDLPLWNVRAVDDDLALSRWPQRVFGSLFAISAVVALILAAVGLYAITAYSVAQRTQEIGIRMALGARAMQVWWLVTRRATVQLAVGLLLGVIGAVGVGRVLPAVLAGTGGADPITLLIVSAVLSAVGLAAALVPARRATRLDPISALRTD